MIGFSLPRDVLVPVAIGPLPSVAGPLLEAMGRLLVAGGFATLRDRNRRSFNQGNLR